MTFRRLVLSAVFVTACGSANDGGCLEHNQCPDGFVLHGMFCQRADANSSGGQDANSGGAPALPMFDVAGHAAQRSP